MFSSVIFLFSTRLAHISHLAFVLSMFLLSIKKKSVFPFFFSLSLSFFCHGVVASSSAHVKDIIVIIRRESHFRIVKENFFPYYFNSSSFLYILRSEREKTQRYTNFTLKYAYINYICQRISLITHTFFLMKEISFRILYTVSLTCPFSV
jgi:hypothetical protein